MEKVKEQNLFEEHFYQIEVVGDVAILREMCPNMPPHVVLSGTKKLVADKLAAILR